MFNIVDRRQIDELDKGSCQIGASEGLLLVFDDIKNRKGLFGIVDALVDEMSVLWDSRQFPES